MDCELSAVFSAHVLPQLSAADFGSLACTASAFRQLVATCPLASWCTAASIELGAQHPALHGDRQGIVRALQQRQAVHLKLKHAERCSVDSLPGELCRQRVDQTRACLRASPDSQLAAATVSCERQHRVLQITHLGAGGKSQLFTEMAKVVDLRWWPDSRHLTTVTGSALYVSLLTLASDGDLGLTSISVHALPSSLSQPWTAKISPDGQVLAIMQAEAQQLSKTHSHSHSCLQVMSASTGAVAPAFIMPAHILCCDWSWSGDGSSLAAIWNSSNRQSHAAILCVSMSQTVVKLQVSFPHTLAMLLDTCWSRDGRHLAVVVGNCGRNRLEILDAHAIDGAGQVSTARPPDVAMPGEEICPTCLVRVAWDPTGQRIACASSLVTTVFERCTGAPLWSAVHVTGQANIQAEAMINAVAWSPDSAILAVICGNESVWIVAAETGEMLARLVTIESYNSRFRMHQLQWLTDGSQLLWLHERPIWDHGLQTNNIISSTKRVAFA